MRDLWQWRPGRQNAAYDVFAFYQFVLFGWGFDAHLIRYRAPVHLPRHTDRVEGKEHFRLNVIIGSVGSPDYAATILNIKNRIILFRPDISEHSVAVERGSRYVLSFGVAVPV